MELREFRLDLFIFLTTWELILNFIYCPSMSFFKGLKLPVLNEAEIEIMSNFQAYGDSEDRFVDDDYPADDAEAEGFLFNVLSVANRDT